MSLRRFAAAAVGVLALLGTACLSTGPEAVPVSELEIVPADGPFAELLFFTPDLETYRDSITMFDVSRLREHVGVSREDMDADPGALWTALEDSDVRLPRSEILGFSTEFLGEVNPIWQRSLGFGVGDIDSTLLTGESTLHPIWVAGGSFDPALTAELLARCDDCLPGDEFVFDGQGLYSWDVDNQLNSRKRLQPPFYDSVGRGGRLAVTEEWALRGNSDAIIATLISYLHGAPSVASRGEFARTAAAADGLGLFAVILTDQTQAVAGGAEIIEQYSSFFDEATAAGMEAAWIPPTDEVLLRPYSVAALGPGVDAVGPFTGLVLAHSSAEDANENVERLAQRIGSVAHPDGGMWSNTFSSIEATTDGTVLVAKLRGAAIYDLFFQLLPLFLHEPS